MTHTEVSEREMCDCRASLLPPPRPPHEEDALPCPQKDNFVLLMHFITPMARFDWVDFALFPPSAMKDAHPFVFLVF